MNDNTRYNRRAYSSAYPGFLIFLIDQGCNDVEIASLIADICNHAIFDIIIRNCDGERPKNRCFISIVEYSNNVKELCSGWLTELDENPSSYKTSKKKTVDSEGGVYEVEVKQPIWIKPISEATSQDGATNMLGALQLAKDLAGKWITNNPNGPAPVIINISNGVPFNNEKAPYLCMRECIKKADEIKSLSNTNESVLLLNVVLSPLLDSQSIRNKYLGVENFTAKISSDIPMELVNEIERLLLIHNLDLSFFSSFKSWYAYGDAQQAKTFLNVVIDILFSHICGEVGQ